MRNISFNLNMNHHRAPAMIFVSQYDNDIPFTATLYQDDEKFIPENMTAIFAGAKSDGETFAASCTINGADASGTIIEEMTDTAGLCTCEIVLYGNNTRMGTANFCIKVEPAPEGE